MPPGNRRQTHGDSVSNKYTGLILQFANAAVLHADDLKYQTYGLAGLVPKRTYYVAVTAYGRAGTESGLSEEITVMVPPRVQRMPTSMQEVLR
jgi:hypothetical protein